MQDIVSPETPQGKHYVYILAYPDNYPDEQKAGTIFYVGKGKGKRILEHEQEARSRKITNSHKVGIIKKIWSTGNEVTKTILACFDTHDEACMYEIALIFFLPNLANKTMGGDGLREPTEDVRYKIGSATRGQKRKPRSETHRLNLSKALTGKRQSEEHRQKNRSGHIGIPAWNKGIPQSEEAKRKMSESLTGRRVTFSEEHRHRLSEATKRYNQKKIPRKPHSEEARRNMSIAQRGHPGRPLSEEHKRKLLEANKNRIYPPLSEEHRRKLSESHRKRYQAQRGSHTFPPVLWPLDLPDLQVSGYIDQLSLWTHDAGLAE